LITNFSTPLIAARRAHKAQRPMICFGAASQALSFLH